MKSFTTANKSILELVELPSLVTKCYKNGKYSTAKFVNFVYICITRGQSNNCVELKLSQKWCTVTPTVTAY